MEARPASFLEQHAQRGGVALQHDDVAAVQLGAGRRLHCGGQGLEAHRRRHIRTIRSSGYPRPSATPAPSRAPTDSAAGYPRVTAAGRAGNGRAEAPQAELRPRPRVITSRDTPSTHSSSSSRRALSSASPGPKDGCHHPRRAVAGREDGPVGGCASAWVTSGTAALPTSPPHPRPAPSAGTHAAPGQVRATPPPPPLQLARLEACSPGPHRCTATRSPTASGRAV